MDFYNVLLAKKTDRVLQFGSLYERLFETWINRARQILKDLPTGAISTVNDAAELPLNALKVSVDAAQDLHGYDYPWVGGAGKNKFDGNYPNINAGVQYRAINLGDGTFTMSTTCPETATTAANLFFIAGNVSSGASTVSNGVSRYVPRTVTAVDGYVTIAYRSNEGVNPQDYNTQIEIGSTATAYEPYSNICPISGWDSGEITVCDDIDNPTQTETYTQQFPTTIYGAEWNVINGELKVTETKKVLSDITGWQWYPQYRDLLPPRYAVIVPDIQATDAVVMCSIFETKSRADMTLDSDNVIFVADGYISIVYNAAESINDFLAIIANQTAIVKLANPTTISQQPLTPRMLEGVNNLWVDCGSVLSGKYWAKA